MRSTRNSWYTLLLAAVLVVMSIVVISQLQTYLASRTAPAGAEASVGCRTAGKSQNPIVAENLCPGTDSWRQDHPLGPQNAIEGFIVPTSVNVGGSVKLFVSTTAPTFTFQVFRLGYYNNLGGRLVYTSSKIHGIQQPAPIFDPAVRKVSCANWAHPATIGIPSSWTSGVYIAKLVSSTGYMRYAMFVVRNDASHSAILFQQSVFTYQAYNAWGGYSLYLGPGGTSDEQSASRSYVVSFDRPYLRGAGLGDFPQSDYDLLRWLERKGYDLTYATDVDVDAQAALLVNHRLILVAGHDEYWSTAMRQHLKAARDAGVALAFFGANDAYWHIRLQNSTLGSAREIICYKSFSLDPVAATDPKSATVRWRDSAIGAPENAILGEMFAGAVGHGGPNDIQPLALAADAQPLLSNTGLTVGSQVPGIVGGEFDRAFDNGYSPSSLIILAVSPIPCTLCTEGNTVANTTIYTAPSGARVFDAGTLYWSWGLDDTDPTAATSTPTRSLSSPGFQQFTANILQYLMRR